MIFVCNAGPVIALAKVDRLALLGELASSVLIPETVFYEVLAKPGVESSRIRTAAASFLKVQSPPTNVDASILHATRRLDAGEQEVIALASALLPSVTAVLDDAAGRRVAAQLHIPVVGLVGLLLIAKQRTPGLLIMPLLKNARDLGYWLSDEIIDIARTRAVE